MTRQLHIPEEPIDVDQQGCRHAGCLPWLLVAGTALIIHQLTGKTILAAALLYAQAWWKPFRCGLWLRGADPLAMIPLYGFLSSRIIARTPGDCWPPSAAK